MTLKCKLNSGVPTEARELIWEVFFASRKRGISLSTHFPWIDKTIGIHCVTLMGTNDKEVLATLVLSEKTISASIAYAMVGMVCVRENWRGNGLCTRLLSETFAFASKARLRSLVLWTKQPGIYLKHGFATEDIDLLLRVRLNPLRERAKIRYAISNADEYLGLPPYAESIVVLESQLARVLIIKTSQSVTLAECEGNPDDIVDLAESALPTTWNLSTARESLICRELRLRGHSYEFLQSSKRMVRHLSAPLQIPYIPLLSRI